MIFKIQNDSGQLSRENIAFCGYKRDNFLIIFHLTILIFHRNENNIFAFIRTMKLGALKSVYGHLNHLVVNNEIRNDL